MCYPSVCFCFFSCVGTLAPPSGENAVFVFFLGGHFAPRIVNIFSEAAARSLKNIEMFLEAATHSLKSKRYIQKQLHKSSWFLHKMYTP